MDAKQLSRRKQGGPSGPGWLPAERVDQIIWNVGRKHLQERRSARGGKSLHPQTATLKNHLRLVGNKHLHFFIQTSSYKTTCSEFRNTLRWDSRTVHGQRNKIVLLCSRAR